MHHGQMGELPQDQLISSDLMQVKAALCSELLSDPELVSTPGVSSQHCSRSMKRNKNHASPGPPQHQHLGGCCTRLT